MRLWQSVKSGWMAFALWLGKINTAILLTAVYFLAIGPTALVSLLAEGICSGSAGTGASYAVPLDRITLTLEAAHKRF
jgi:hypothetical protein